MGVKKNNPFDDSKTEDLQLLQYLTDASNHYILGFVVRACIVRRKTMDAMNSHANKKLPNCRFVSIHSFMVKLVDFLLGGELVLFCVVVSDVCVLQTSIQKLL